MINNNNENNVHITNNEYRYITVWDYFIFINLYVYKFNNEMNKWNIKLILLK